MFDLNQSDDSDYEDDTGFPKLKPKTLIQTKDNLQNKQPQVPFDWGTDDDDDLLTKPILLTDAFKDRKNKVKHQIQCDQLDAKSKESLLDELRLAAYNGNVQFIAKYVPKFIDVNVNLKGKTSWKLLMSACIGAQENVIQYLVNIPGCNPNEGYKLFTPIMAVICCEISNLEDEKIDQIENRIINCLDILIISGANINNKDSFGTNALSFAIKNNYLKVAQYLISKGCNVNNQDLFGDSPLHIASRFANGPAVSLLLKYDSDLTLTNKCYETPIQCAKHSGLKKFSLLMDKLGREKYFKKYISTSLIDKLESFTYEKPSIFSKLLTNVTNEQNDPVDDDVNLICNEEIIQVTQSLNNSPYKFKLPSTTILCLTLTTITIVAFWCKRRI